MFTRRLDYYFLGLLGFNTFFFFQWLWLAQQVIRALPSGRFTGLVFGQLGLLSIGSGLLIMVLVEATQAALKDDDTAQLVELRRIFQKTIWMMMIFFLSSLLSVVK